MNHNKSFIKSQPYIKVIRQVDRIEKREIREQRYLYLYEDRLESKFHSFTLSEIMDLSFKKLQGDGGILFIHTDHGVYSYTVNSSPECFMEACKHQISQDRLLE